MNSTYDTPALCVWQAVRLHRATGRAAAGRRRYCPCLCRPPSCGRLAQVWLWHACSHSTRHAFLCRSHAGVWFECTSFMTLFPTHTSCLKAGFVSKKKTSDHYMLYVLCSLPGVPAPLSASCTLIAYIDMRCESHEQCPSAPPGSC